METPSFIEFRKVRTVGDVINVTFQFLRENFRPLGKALLYIVGPLVLLTSAFMALFQVQFFGEWLGVSTQGEEEMLAFFTSILGTLGLAMVLSIVTNIVLMAVLLSYIQHYQERKSGDISVDEMWTATKANFGKLFVTSLLLMLVLFVPIPIVIIPCLGAVAYLVWMVYAGFTFSIMYPMRIEESIGALDAFSRARALIKGRFWPTAGVIFLAYLIFYVVSNAFGIPAMIVGFLYGFHALEGEVDGSMIYQVVLGVSTVLQTVASVLLACIPLTAIAFQYYSLVEQEEHAGLMARIDAVGPIAPPERPATEPPPLEPPANEE